MGRAGPARGGEKKTSASSTECIRGSLGATAIGANPTLLFREDDEDGEKKTGTLSASMHISLATDSTTTRKPEADEELEADEEEEEEKEGFAGVAIVTFSTTKMSSSSSAASLSMDNRPLLSPPAPNLDMSLSFAPAFTSSAGRTGGDRDWPPGDKQLDVDKVSVCKRRSVKAFSSSPYEGRSCSGCDSARRCRCRQCTSTGRYSSPVTATPLEGRNRLVDAKAEVVADTEEANREVGE